MFFHFRLLLATLVSDVFSYLIKNDLTMNFDFSDYVFYNYVSVDAVFPPILWFDKPPEEARTTNGPESLHRHYNSPF